MGRDRLARTLAQRYGYKLAAVEDALLTRRRIRVRANVEQAAAEKHKAELEALGAIVVVVEPKTPPPVLVEPPKPPPAPAVEFRKPSSPASPSPPPSPQAPPTPAL